MIDISERDADVSDTGHHQARALGAFLRQLSRDDLPVIAVASPYLRARQTAELALDALPVRLIIDERLAQILDIEVAYPSVTASSAD